MSKLFSSKRFILKPIKQNSNNDYINQSMQNIIDPYSKENPNITNNFSTYNPNNITMEYPRHYSPPGKSFQSLPPISSKVKKGNNSQKKTAKTLTNSNSSKNLYSQGLFGPGNKKPLEREKTQVNIMENDLQNNKIELNSIEELDDLNTGTSVNKMNNGVTQINNITNINIHIYQSNANSENQNPNSNKTKLGSTFKIGSYVFGNCTKLDNIVIDSNVIGDYMFDGCTGLKKVYITGNYCTSITSITVPNVSEIGDYAFAYNDELLTATVNCTSDTVLGSYLFAYDTKLTTVKLSNTLTTIPAAAFYNCTALTTIYNDTETPVLGKVVIPSSVVDSSPSPYTFFSFSFIS